MTQAIKPLVAGNWKMHGRLAKAAEIQALKAKMAESDSLPVDVMICPPAPYLVPYREEMAGSAIGLGAQDCHAGEDGAHTGDISAEMLADVGCTAVIVGHSERRTDHGESDAMINAKARAAHRAGLTAIICIGETEEERDKGATLDVLDRQLGESVPDGAGAGDTVIAYEPVWAIGTGRTPTNDEVAEAHGFIRQKLSERLGATGAEMRILYGGSMKPGNAGELIAIENVNGGLVGGASLKADDFWGIITAAAGV